VRLFLADVAKRVLDSGWGHDPGPRPAFGSLAAHVEPDVAREHLEALFLVRVVVRGHIATGIGEHLRMQSVAVSAERESLATYGVMNELGHSILSFCLSGLL
jgi:hypothetical protein